MTPQSLTKHGRRLTYQKTCYRKGKFHHFEYRDAAGTPWYFTELPPIEQPTKHLGGIIAQVTMYTLSLYFFVKRLNVLP